MNVNSDDKNGALIKMQIEENRMPSSSKTDH